MQNYSIYAIVYNRMQLESFTNFWMKQNYWAK